MKTKTIALSLVPWFVGAAVYFAAAANMMGTWKAERGEVKIRARGAQEQHRCLRGCG